MYIRLTSKCNMRCAHCCFSATSRGQDMSLATFKAALKLARDYDTYITLGGGEPTLHPEFEHFLRLAIANHPHEEYKPHIITNGKLTDRALLLARLADKNVISAELSRDEWHEPVDGEVYQAFGKNIRDVTDRLIPVGRAKQLYRDGYEPERSDFLHMCCCDDWIVEPDGSLKQCGCRKSPVIGDAFHGVKQEYQCASGTCYNSEEFAERCEVLV